MNANEKLLRRGKREEWELHFETQLRQVMPNVPFEHPAYPLKPQSKAEADFLIDGWLVVEIQGGIWIKGGHSTGQGIERDIRKLAMFTRAGYLVLQFEPKWIESGEAIDYTRRIYQDWIGRVPIWRPRSN